MNDRFSSQPFRLDEDGLCHQLASMLSPRTHDLLQIAMQIYVADRLTELARCSVSCVHYPRRVQGSRKQCGVCPESARSVA